MKLLSLVIIIVIVVVGLAWPKSNGRCLYSVHVGDGEAPENLPEGYTHYCSPLNRQFVPMRREAYTPVPTVH